MDGDDGVRVFRPGVEAAVHRIGRSEWAYIVVPFSALSVELISTVLGTDERLNPPAKADTLSKDGTSR
jgi:hypothetical protein